MSRRAAHKDVLHAPIGKMFVDHGWDALDLAGVGNGVPDWLFAKVWFALLLEVKSPAHIRKSRVDDPFTEDQHAFRRKWRGPIYTVESLYETQELLDLLDPLAKGVELAPKQIQKLTLFEFAKEGAP